MSVTALVPAAPPPAVTDENCTTVVDVLPLAATTPEFSPMTPGTPADRVFQPAQGALIASIECSVRADGDQYSGLYPLMNEG